MLVVDLDLESPGVSSAALAAADPPDFGVVDWFVEDLVEQGDRVIERMSCEPEWVRNLRARTGISFAFMLLPFFG